MARDCAMGVTLSLYSIHPGVKMVQDWVATLKIKTGRSLEQWVKFIQTAGPESEKERRDWPKKEHGLGTNAAWWLAERAEGKGGEDDDPKVYLKTAVQWVEVMYSGGKAGLRPIHDGLVSLAKTIGKDIKVCPCKTMIPLYRNHVFAEIKPSTRTRIDLGLALAKAKGRLPKRLIDTGGLQKKDRITHRIPMTSLDDIDDEVKRWLTAAYNLDG